MKEIEKLVIMFWLTEDGQRVSYKYLYFYNSEGLGLYFVTKTGEYFLFMSYPSQIIILWIIK